MKKNTLSAKILLIAVSAIIVSIAILGAYFDEFLKSIYFDDAKRRIADAKEKINYDIYKIQEDLIKGVSFIKDDKAMVASISLIDNYQDKQNYNAVLLDEEKKDITQQLLRRVKIAFNSDILLYDKNGELISYVYKNTNGYKLNFISYKEGKPLQFSKEEFDNTYTQVPYTNDSTKWINYKHILYYQQPELKKHTLITYHYVKGALYIRSHKSLFNAQGNTLAHIEMSYKIDDIYFANVSKNLNMDISLAVGEPYTKEQQIALDDKTMLKDSDIFQTKSHYYTPFKIQTKEQPVYIVVALDKTMLNQVVSKNRQELIFFILFIGSVTLIVLYLSLQKNLSNPLKELMNNIFKIEKGDYSGSAIIQSSDEIEEISKSINKLAEAVSKREKELKESHKKLEYLSTHDELTELLNRRAFDKKLEKAIDKALKEEKRVALFFLDLDQFKQVNDTLGHKVGDELLQEVAKRLDEFLNDQAVFARIGGDEFKIFLDDFDDIEVIDKVAQVLIQEFERPFICGDYEINTTASIGIAIAPENGRDAVTLIKNADLAMYRSKDRGRNNYSFFTDRLAEYISNRISIINALKYALKDKNEFSLLYQPKVSIQTGETIAVEALVRWNSSKLGFMPPNEFIGIAEDTHMIIEIGKWVLQKACEDFLVLKNHGYALRNMSVNISGVQLYSSDLYLTLKEVIEKTGMDTNELELEVTESYIASNVIKAIGTLSKFRELGIGLAIDDFGTGYSSMSYLQKLPITRLKIDKAFVDDLPYSKESVAVVKAILALAETFGLKITVEGVETVEQLEFFRDKRCDEIQGYYYSKPLPLEELKVFLSEQRKRA